MRTPGVGAAPPATWRTWLALGRVSNLPTVWSNALAGWLLSGQTLDLTLDLNPDLNPDLGRLALLLAALSLFYVAGMYLNDAFDAEIDARERSARPIPAGMVGRGTVFGLGFGMLGVGIALGFVPGLATGLAGLALAAGIVLYDWLHKRVASGPLIMGVCRFLTYAMAALAAGGDVGGAVLAGGFGLFCHTVGLTCAARQEAYNRLGSVWPLLVLAVPVGVAGVMAGVMSGGVLAFAVIGLYVAWGARSLRCFFRRAPGDVPRGVVGLIAGISLYDAALIAAVAGALTAPCLAALACFAATLALQRLAPGT
ncbi:MAG: UbiA family prenyltransferase [Thiotrichales bacterium]|nr:UbiA family prenyltransferase [Thiotrichales bacterium]